MTGRVVLSAEEAAAVKANETAMAELLRQLDELRIASGALVEICCQPGHECLVCRRRECRPPCRALAVRKILDRSRA